MKRISTPSIKRFMIRTLALAAGITFLALTQLTASSTAATLPVLWTAGGLSAGSNSVGQASRITADQSGNIAIVSGPAFARSLAVTSYTANGSLRWQQTVSPVSGTFMGNWIAAAPNGDFVAVGTNIDSHGSPIGITLVRYTGNGALIWQRDLPVYGIGASVGRLLVDAAGNAYLVGIFVGNGFDATTLKYSPAGDLLWSCKDLYIATSAALSSDEADIALTGSVSGNASWRVAVHDAATGTLKWFVNAPEGIASLDVIMDASRVYVTGLGNVGLTGYLTVIAYDRATGAQLWRTDANPPSGAARGIRLALAPDGSLVVAGHTASGGYFDWWTVALNNNGTIKWEALRNQALSGDEFPTSVFVLADGTAVVSGTGGPVIRDVLGNSFMQGVTVGYSPTGVLLWEAFSVLPAVWATPLPNGAICATGGYDALVTCWQTPGAVNYQPILTAAPVRGTAPLTVNFRRSVTSDPKGPVISYVLLDYGNTVETLNPVDLGDGTSTFTVNQTSSTTYQLPGTYTATLTVFYANATSSSTSVTITVAPSAIPAQLPLITANPANGTAPLNVTFTTSATMDPNGPMINSYSISYGDGTSNSFILNFGNGATAFNSTSTHTYNTASGAYNAILTVTYNDASSASSAVTVTVNSVVTTPVLRSTAITMSATLQKSKVSANGTVIVKDANGAAVPGAMVSAIWTKPGGETVTQTATTGTTGNAKFSTTGNRGTYTLKIKGINKAGYIFDSTSSVMSGSISK